MRYRHIIVIEDNDNILVNITGLVQTFIGQSGCHGTISDDGDYFSIIIFQTLGTGYPQSR